MVVTDAERFFPQYAQNSHDWVSYHVYICLFWEITVPKLLWNQMAIDRERERARDVCTFWIIMTYYTYILLYIYIVLYVYIYLCNYMYIYILLLLFFLLLLLLLWLLFWLYIYMIIYIYYDINSIVFLGPHSSSFIVVGWSGVSTVVRDGSAVLL
jgi:hypothetical protein